VPLRHTIAPLCAGYAGLPQIAPRRLECVCICPRLRLPGTTRLVFRTSLAHSGCVAQMRGSYVHLIGVTRPSVRIKCLAKVVPATQDPCPLGWRFMSFAVREKNVVDHRRSERFPLAHRLYRSLLRLTGRAVRSSECRRARDAKRDIPVPLSHCALPLTLIRFDPPCAKKIDPSHDLS